MTEELTGTIKGRRDFSIGDTHLTGTLYGPARVRRDGRLVVNGTIYGPLTVHGRLVVMGTVYRELIIEADGDCILEGAVYGEVVNRGTLRADVDLLGEGSIRDAGGKQLPHTGSFRRERHPDGTLTHIWDA